MSCKDDRNRMRSSNWQYYSFVLFCMILWQTSVFNFNSSLVSGQLLSSSSSSSQQPGQSWFGCAGCCGYVAGAAGWACCRVRGALYSACFNNTDCSVVSSQCILGCCQCPFPFFRQNTCQQCELIPRVLGSQCMATSECARDIFRAVCVNGVCQCASAYKSSCLNTVCQCVPRTLGDQCAQDLDCSIHVLNSVCSGGTCQCGAGYSPNVCGQCVPGQPLNALGVGLGGLALSPGVFGSMPIGGKKREVKKDNKAN